MSFLSDFLLLLVVLLFQVQPVYSGPTHQVSRLSSFFSTGALLTLAGIMTAGHYSGIFPLKYKTEAKLTPTEAKKASTVFCPVPPMPIKKRKAILVSKNKTSNIIRLPPTPPPSPKEEPISAPIPAPIPAPKYVPAPVKLCFLVDWIQQHIRCDQFGLKTSMYLADFPVSEFYAKIEQMDEMQLKKASVYAIIFAHWQQSRAITSRHFGLALEISFSQEKKLSFFDGFCKLKIPSFALERHQRKHFQSLDAGLMNATKWHHMQKADGIPYEPPSCFSWDAEQYRLY